MTRSGVEDTLANMTTALDEHSMASCLTHLTWQGSGPHLASRTSGQQTIRGTVRFMAGLGVEVLRDSSSLLVAYLSYKTPSPPMIAKTMQDGPQ